MTPCSCERSSLNEVQFPKELRHLVVGGRQLLGEASMKCSSRRNCDDFVIVKITEGTGPQ